MWLSSRREWVGAAEALRSVWVEVGGGVGGLYELGGVLVPL